MPVLQSRHALATLMPPFAQRERGHAFTTEGLFTLYDMDAGIMSDALQARFPSHAPVDALPMIARDRRIRTGPYANDQTIRAQLRQWIDVWQLSGLPLGLLLALQAYLAPGFPQIRIVTRSGVWYTLREGAVGRMLSLPGYVPLPLADYELGPEWPTDAKPATQVERLRKFGYFFRLKAPSPNFDWDSQSHPENATKWWHFWVIVYPPHYPIQQPYDSELWTYDDPLESWGFDEPYGTFDTFKAIIRDDFKPSRARCVAVIFCPSSLDFNPSNAVNAPGMPDGYWGWEVKLEGGVWVSTRRPDCRYLHFREND